MGCDDDPDSFRRMPGVGIPVAFRLPALMGRPGSRTPTLLGVREPNPAAVPPAGPRSSRSTEARIRPAAMLSSTFLILVLGALTAAGVPGASGRTEGADTAVTAVTDWVVSSADNICGLRDPQQLSNPAKLDFERCLAGTPEMKKLKQDGIRPDSPEGIQLRCEAVDRLTKAANTVRQAGGYCSVWKAIENSDGRRIPDLTTRVLGQY